MRALFLRDRMTILVTLHANSSGFFFLLLLFQRGTGARFINKSHYRFALLLHLYQSLLFSSNVLITYLKLYLVSLNLSNKQRVFYLKEAFLKKTYNSVTYFYPTVANANNNNPSLAQASTITHMQTWQTAQRILQ